MPTPGSASFASCGAASCRRRARRGQTMRPTGNCASASNVVSTRRPPRGPILAVPEVAHRLNRLEYANAVRDLLAVEIDAAALLPADDSSYGFDNIAGVLKMSSALMERYLAAARTVSRLAVGSPPPAVGTSVYRVSSEVQQHERIDGLPFGTRGGTLIRHTFPQDAEYDIKVGVSGRGGGTPQQLEVSIDGARVKVFALEGRQQPELRVPITGGPHDVAVTFLRVTPDLVEQVREPFLNPDAPSGTGGQTGPVTAVSSVTIAGPYNASGPGDTVSRRRLFTCQPTAIAQEARCARTILSALARRAYRGTVTPAALDVLMRFFDQGRGDGGSFDAGIELALRRLLVSPEFLYRIEADPAPAGGQPATDVYRLGDRELASRLSFFLWSSIPDDALLDAADNGTLRTATGLRTEVRRMLADPKARTLAENFGGQWLQIRNMPTTRPGETFALAFDETLRQAMQRETELLLDSVIRENRGVMELLTADYTFLNERLAQHYNIAGVQGSHFRRVALPADSPRRGLLGHGSILTLTSPAIRTSPVIRGKWILNNILGAPPPDPPPNVPALPDRRTQAKVKTMRERMAEHRSNPVCSTCHSMIDPTGFALENFDAIGRWRTVDESYNAIDASGQLPDGSSFTGVRELRASLATHPERFAHTVTEKLMTYALGRGVEPYDMPAIRKIMRDTAPAGYQVQAIIVGIVQSYPFQYRRTATSRRAAGCRESPITLRQDCHVHCQAVARSADVPAGRRCGDRAALPRRDGAGSRRGAISARCGSGSSTSRTACGRRTFTRRATAARAIQITPVLRAIESLREHAVVISGLSNMPVLANDQGGGVHTRNHSGWLSGVLPKRTEGANITSAKTADQFAADVLGADTSLRSLELTLESNYQVGNCEAGYSCAYLNSTSWRAPNAPLPHESDPRVVFQRLFGDGGTVAARLTQMQKDRSILDSVMESLTALKKRLGVTDQTVMGDYLDAIRDVEQRIQRAERTNDSDAAAGARAADGRTGRVRRARPADARPAAPRLSG